MGVKRKRQEVCNTEVAVGRWRMSSRAVQVLIAAAVWRLLLAFSVREVVATGAVAALRARYLRR